MFVVYVRGGPRPVGGIPRPVPDPSSGTLWSFFAYLPDSPALAVVNEAIDLIRQRTAMPGVIEACDTAFRAIRNISFTDLFSGATQVTIYRHPTAVARDEFGLTEGTGLARHITLSRNCWGLQDRNAAVLRTAATLVHELAHCAGAAGGASTVAESTLQLCGFADQFIPGLAG